MRRNDAMPLIQIARIISLRVASSLTRGAQRVMLALRSRDAGQQRALLFCRRRLFQ
jgi:hypothetical protein